MIPFYAQLFTTRALGHNYLHLPWPSRVTPIHTIYPPTADRPFAIDCFISKITLGKLQIWGWAWLYSAVVLARRFKRVIGVDNEDHNRCFSMIVIGVH